MGRMEIGKGDWKMFEKKVLFRRALSNDKFSIKSLKMIKNQFSIEIFLMISKIFLQNSTLA